MKSISYESNCVSPNLLSYECSTIAKLAQEIEDVQTMRQQLKTTTASPLDETDETEEFRL